MEKIKISEIVENNLQPRNHFDENSIKELSENIKEYGLIEPIIIRPFNKKYQVVCGERRLRACKLAGFKEIDAIVKLLTDKQAFEMSLIENIQRDNLSPIEEALAYQKLKEDYKQKELSKKFNVSEGRISQKLALLNLPDDIRRFFYDYGELKGLTEKHGRILLKFNDYLNKFFSKGDIKDIFSKPIKCISHCNTKMHGILIDNNAEEYKSLLLPLGATETYLHSNVKGCTLFDVAQLAFFENLSTTKLEKMIRQFIAEITKQTLIIFSDMIVHKDINTGMAELDTMIAKYGMKDWNCYMYEQFCQPFTSEYYESMKDKLPTKWDNWDGKTVHMVPLLLELSVRRGVSPFQLIWNYYDTIFPYYEMEFENRDIKSTEVFTVKLAMPILDTITEMEYENSKYPKFEDTLKERCEHYSYFVFLDSQKMKDNDRGSPGSIKSYIEEKLKEKVKNKELTFSEFGKKFTQVKKCS